MIEAIKTLEKALLKLALETEAKDVSDLPGLCRHYKFVYECEEELEKLYKILSGIKLKMSYETLPKAIEGAGFDNYVKVAGRTFSVATRINASIPVDMRAKGHQWLRENNLAELIQETANPKALSSAIKSYIEEKGMQPPEDAVKVHMQPYTSMKKA